MRFRVEGAHAYLKQYLSSKKSKGDLFTTWQKIEAAINNQIINIQGLAASERQATPLNLDRKLFRPIFGVVTWFALRLVQAHCDQVSQPLRPCTGTFTSAMGLPCAYICDERKHIGGLQVIDFDEHWF